MNSLKYITVTVGILLLTGVSTAFAQGPHFSDWSAPTNLAPVNTPATDGCPLIAKDGRSLYFASNRPGALGLLDIYVSERAKRGDPWGPPRNVGITINSSANDICPTLTVDSHFLFFVSEKPGGCGAQDLYVAFRRNKHDNLAWEQPTNLGCQINSPQNDFTPSLFDDDEGNVLLYFSSNRPGGPGGTDIYQSELLEDGTFSSATLVPTLNTAANDQRPNIRHDGLEIFFDSNRPGSAGSDLWSATRASAYAAWTTPTNLGLVINSASTEGRPSISFDGSTLYFMSDRPGGSGGLDVYVTTRSRLRGQTEATHIFVRQHYFDFLQREPDLPGLEFWMGQILRCLDAECFDRKRVDVSRAFFFSSEFIASDPRFAENLRGTLSYNEAFVEQCYRLYLQREPDADGLSFWVDKLNSRIPRVTDHDYSEMIRAFILSEEYRMRLGL